LCQCYIAFADDVVAEQLLQLIATMLARVVRGITVDAELDFHLRRTGAKAQFHILRPIGHGVTDYLLGGRLTKTEGLQALDVALWSALQLLGKSGH
jgi:hypothetical protein